MRAVSFARCLGTNAVVSGFFFFGLFFFFFFFARCFSQRAEKFDCPKKLCLT